MEGIVYHKYSLIQTNMLNGGEKKGCKSLFFFKNQNPQITLSHRLPSFSAILDAPDEYLKHPLLSQGGEGREGISKLIPGTRHIFSTTHYVRLSTKLSSNVQHFGWEDKGTALGRAGGGWGIMWMPIPATFSLRILCWKIQKFIKSRDVWFFCVLFVCNIFLYYCIRMKLSEKMINF